MYKKFEAIMNKYMMPLAHKVDKQRHWVCQEKCVSNFLITC